MVEKLPQTNINGKDNVWLMKPGSGWRGEGITIHYDLESIVERLERRKKAGGKVNRKSMVAQKYVENPLTIDGHKMDIRVWVLITDFDPLTVWVF